MSDLWDKIVGEAKKISLSDSERSLIMSKVKSQIQNYPGLPAKQGHVETPYFFNFRFGISMHRVRFVPVAVILIIVLFGGTAFAANYALPGETLYSMKVKVNEEIESWVALTPDANLRFEQVKAERRLEEAEKLTVKKKKITPKAKAQIKENFSKNATKVKEIVTELAASGESTKAAEVKAEFEGKLTAHSVVLSKLANNEDEIVEIDDEAKTDIAEINSLVDAHIVDLQTEDETGITDEDVADSKQEDNEVKKETKEEKKETNTKSVEDVKPAAEDNPVAGPEVKAKAEIEVKTDIKSESAEAEGKSESGIEVKTDSKASVDEQVETILKELKLEN